jgi:hypothetical protein
MKTVVNRLLTFCSGLVLILLKRAGYRKGQHIVQAVSVLATSMFAMLSSTYALQSVYGFLPLSICFGVVWGTLIFCIDSHLVNAFGRRTISTDLATHPNGSRTLRIIICVCPRLFFGILVALIVAVPLQLKLFEPDINRQIAHTKAIAISEIERRIKEDFSQLNELVGLTTSLRNELIRKQQESDVFWMAAKTELEGSAGTLIPGAGPAYEHKENLARESKAEIMLLGHSVGPVIKRNDRKIASLTAEKDALLVKAKQQLEIGTESGLVQKVQALQELSNTNPTIRWVVIILTLLFVFLEITPLLIKLLSGENTEDDLRGRFSRLLTTDGAINTQKVGTQYGGSGSIEFGVLVLELILPTKDRDYLIGDLLEEYEALCLKKRMSVSVLWFYKQITTSLIPLLVKQLIDAATRKLRS